MIKDAEIKIPKKILNEMMQHAKHEFPNECCGYLAGTENKVSDCYRMTNIDQSPEHFSFDPKEQFEVVKKARKSGNQLLSVYHSHPETRSCNSLWTKEAPYSLELDRRTS